MKRTLGGSLFIRNGNKYDYCYREAILSLQAICDHVVVLDAGSDDGTQDELKKLANSKTTLIFCNNDEWEEQGRERFKLAYFTNKAMAFLDTDWHLNLQADEVIHENSYDAIREAISDDTAHGYWCKRINLWGSSEHELNVVNERKPVGTEVLRLARNGYQSVEDAQSIHCPSAKWDYLNKIRMYHFGFVRNKYVHCEKIRHMITEIFNWEMDKKVEAMDGVFDPWAHFSREDLIPIWEPLPEVVKEWAAERDRINNFLQV